MRLLHLVGSAESQFFCDLSRLYARDCLDSLGTSHRSHIAYVTPDRRWRFLADLTDGSIAAAPPMALAEAVRTIVDLRIDAMVPQMFCLSGMTEYRGLFDLLAIPYLGNVPAAMALTADKGRAKAVVAGAGVRVPTGEVLGPGERPKTAPPAVVKPVGADNSVGVAYVATVAGYDEALAGAFAHSDRVLVERFIEPGREVRCGVIERGGELWCLPLEEYRIDAVRRPIRTVEDKLRRDDGGNLQLVAKHTPDAWIVDPSDPVTAAVWSAARRGHVALGCRHYSLFDFRIDPAGVPWFLEAGLYCSFAPNSVIAVMAAAAGVGVEELFAMVLAAALPS